MRRISHDLPGVAQRIAKLSNEFELAVHETKEAWRDEKGTAFFQRHTSEVAPTINQLVNTLTQTVEMFEEIARRIRDPDMH